VWSVGRKPQEDWCPRFAIEGNTELFVIETVWLSSGGFVPFAGSEITDLAPWPGLSTISKAGVLRRGGRHGERESLEEEARERVALHRSKGWCELADPVEPQERKRDETSPRGLQAKQDVERARNPEDGQCRRLESPGDTGACFCRTL
jgi:hypothetical protein